MQEDALPGGVRGVRDGLATIPRAGGPTAARLTVASGPWLKQGRGRADV